jgi:cell division protein FtsQ
MLRRINWRAVLISFVWLISLAGLITLMSFIEIKKSEITCTKVEVILPGNQFFIERAEVDEILKLNNRVLVGRKLNNLDIQSLEDKLNANPFIEYAKVYIDMDGVIHADVKQRVPVLRVLNLAGQDFYIDQNGFKIPISDHFTARVLVANGAILEDFSGKVDTLRTQLGRDLFQTAKYIALDSLWKEQIVQVYVNNNKDMELVPRVGNQKIIFGDAVNMNEKFRNLLLFYKNALPKVGWDTYSSINLKFKGQIVCERRDSTLMNATIPMENALDSTKTEVKETQDSINKIL